MVNLPLALYSAEQVKQLDKLAMVKAHLSPSELMQRAALAAWKVFLQHWPKAKNVAVICGGGNNGGDGYEFACLAKQQGLTVNLYDIAPNDFTKRTSESQGARQKWLESGGQIQAILEKFDEDVIVDALLGIGTRFPLEKSFTNAILAINQSQKPVLSMDIPSGLQCDLGILPSVCVNATVTITFVGIKIGLLSHQGNEVIGELFYDNLGISNEILNTISPIAHRIDYDTLKAKLPVRRLTANKSSQGHVLIIGAGKAQFGGAVCLAGEAALRAGAGLVSVAVSPESVVRTSRATSELMMTGCQSFEEMKALFERAASPG